MVVERLELRPTGRRHFFISRGDLVYRNSYQDGQLVNAEMCYLGGGASVISVINVCVDCCPLVVVVIVVIVVIDQFVAQRLEQVLMLFLLAPSSSSLFYRLSCVFFTLGRSYLIT